MSNKNLPDHIQNFFAEREGSKEAFHSREIFQAERKDVDIKTDLSIQEIALINAMKFNDKLLHDFNIKPVFNEFINDYMRLKISLDRKSRGEFVAINKSDNTDETLSKMSDLSNIKGVRK